MSTHMMRVYETHAAASEHLGDDDMVVGCRLSSLGGSELDAPVERYLVVPKATSDAEIRARLFEMRNGREMSSYEHFIDELAHRPDGAEDPL